MNSCEHSLLQCGDCRAAAKAAWLAARTIEDVRIDVELYRVKLLDEFWESKGIPQSSGLNDREVER